MQERPQCTSTVFLRRHEAERTLRFVVQDIYLLRAEKPDEHWRSNSARADRHLGQLPATWAAGKADSAATRELLALLREGKTASACDLAIKQLLSGVGARAYGMLSTLRLRN
jgi:hypothetical protein